jgi:hypothetical protein
MSKQGFAHINPSYAQVTEAKWVETLYVSHHMATSQIGASKQEENQ